MLSSKGCETFHKTLSEAQAGDQVGLLVKGVKREEVKRGMVIAKPGTASQHDFFEAQVYLLTKDEGGTENPLTDYGLAHLYSKTYDTVVHVRLPNLDEREMIMPGEDGQ